jgi:hypothetical protein
MAKLNVKVETNFFSQDFPNEEMTKMATRKTIFFSGRVESSRDKSGRVEKSEMRKSKLQISLL